MEALNFLKSNVKSEMPLLSIVDVFSRMCRTKIDYEDELYLFETNTVSCKGKDMFQLSLVRQLSGSNDEPKQIHLDITYNLTEDYSNLLTCSWHENYGDLIQTVLFSKVFEKCKNNHIEKIDIWMEET